MTLVDSSVWIDYFNGVETIQTEFLNNGIGLSSFGIGDLIYGEVMQGFRADADFKIAQDFFEDIPVLLLIDKELALRSAQNYRFLRKKGITVRKTIDSYIATYCIEKNLTLLHSDRDFEPFVAHLGLKSIF
ncbi:type II toxin-antitoxin system VapC family toxin [Algoriphagus terrigena]|uniref:type II toxin-antitoxin system VapC family toxin n=1 Tax=Algoriphagus terrigena TaxID=344884 RepID=UPI00047EA224|nr:PIN domain nuclease [Algoriphagus terrigena]